MYFVCFLREHFSIECEGLNAAAQVCADAPVEGSLFRRDGLASKGRWVRCEGAAAHFCLGRRGGG